MNFTDFNLNETLLKGLETAGYITCTPVQEQVLKIAGDGSDLYVQSQTGTGKTAAYLVAIIQKMLSTESDKRRQALIMVPTRELAVQVEEEAKVLCSVSGLKPFSFYGGVGYDKQIDALKKGVDIIVGTPGRLIDLNEGKNLDLSNVGFLVIDEADRMFDMGFYAELRTLLKVLPPSEQRQTMLFSATLNSYVKNLAWEYSHDAKEITIESDNITVSEIDQELLHVSSNEKMKLLIGILKNEKPASVIIFCNTKRSCEVVSKRLCMNGLNSEFIIGDLPQSRRLKILNDFKEGKLSVLVATDVAARGIDVDDLAMVINYDLPNEAENYVHRIGRTARAGKTGKAYTFCSEQDVYNLPPVERYIEMQIPAKVADLSQMVEDQSAGVYIKTENWHEENNEARGGSRHSYRSRSGGSGYSRNDRSYSHGDKPRSGGHGYKDAGGKNSRSNGYKGGFDRKVNHGGKKEDFSKMENMSLEDRMKIYKEKYSKGTSSANGTKRPYNKNGPKGNNRRYEKNYSAGNSNRNNYRNGRNYADKNARPQQSAPVQKKGLLAKLKAFFGK